MKEPQFVALEVVLDAHAAGIDKFGGAHGARDLPAIESALGAAQNAFYYADADLFEIAATYAYHLAQAQAFFDGNKRAAVATALLFLAANGCRKKPESAHLHDAMIAIAERRLDKQGLAAVFRQLCG